MNYRWLKGDKVIKRGYIFTKVRNYFRTVNVTDEVPAREIIFRTDSNHFEVTSSHLHFANS